MRPRYLRICHAKGKSAHAAGRRTHFPFAVRPVDYARRVITFQLGIGAAMRIVKIDNQGDRLGSRSLYVYISRLYMPDAKYARFSVECVAFCVQVIVERK